MSADLRTLVDLARDSIEADRGEGRDLEAQVRGAASALRDCWSVHWSEAEARKVDVDARPTIRVLAEMVEYAYMTAFPLDVVWSTRAKWARDMMTTTPIMGTIALVSQRERETTAGEAPWLRLTLSIPVWLASDDYARERALHALLACYAPDLADKPTKLLRMRPDIVAHSSTLARYGVDAAREAQAVMAAAAHAVTAYRIEQSGQLVAWDVAPRALEHAAELRAQPVLTREDGEPRKPRRRRGAK